MQIKRVNTYHVRSDLAEPFGFSQFYYTQRENLLVQVVSDCGMTGWGECYGPVRPTREAIHDHIEPMIIGRNPFDLDRLAWGGRTELRFASPSPFRGETVLHFTLAEPSRARLAVYDVAGRLVRVLIDEELQPGDHDTIWDGRNDTGLRVSGGTYFVKLTTGRLRKRPK